MEQLIKIQKQLDELFTLVRNLEQGEQKAMMNSEEACSFLGIQLSTLYKHTSLGNIAYYKPNGKLIMFKKQDLLNWLEAHRIPSNNELSN